MPLTEWVTYPESGFGKLVDFRRMNNGHIECQECMQVWCHHIEGLVREHQDAPFLWEKPDEEMLPTSLQTMVPMFPNEMLWTHVVLEPLVGPAPRYAIEWLHPVTQNMVDLGSLNPGEARWVLRSLIWEYSLGDSMARTECMASSHGFSQETQYQRNIRSSSKMVWVEKWSLYDSGWCLSCQTQTASATDPDLVPTKQGSGVWD